MFPALKLRWSWRELKQHVNEIAAALIALGVEAGEHVGIWSMNVPEWVVDQLAAARIGAVLVNVNPAYRVHELQDALTMADVATLVVGSPFKDSNFVSMVEALCPEVAAATSRDWSSARFPRLKRLIALGDRPGPGLVDLGRPRARAARVSTLSWRHAPGRSRRPTCTTSSSPRERPGCPRGPC